MLEERETESGERGAGAFALLPLPEGSSLEPTCISLDDESASAGACSLAAIMLMSIPLRSESKSDSCMSSMIKSRTNMDAACAAAEDDVERTRAEGRTAELLRGADDDAERADGAGGWD